MRILLLCLLLGLAPISQADVPVARVNGVEISSMRLERYFAEYLQDQGRPVASPHFSQPCALGRFDGRRSSQVAQAADSADFGQAPASALEQGACGRVDGV